MAHVDCETLLLPLSGDSPVGAESHFAMTLAPVLRELRREESADQFSDATRPAQLKRADWDEVIRLCEEALAEHAKDLRTACHLTEARTRTHGLRGLAEGLELVARLVDECWDRIAPAEGEDPAESRGVPLANLLDDPDRGLCFPNQIRTLPLIGENEHARSYIEWTRLRSAHPSPATTGETNDLGRLRQRIAPEQFKFCHEAAAAALYWLADLRKSLDERLGDSAPGLLKLETAIRDVHGLLDDELKLLGFATSASDEQTEESSSVISQDKSPAPGVTLGGAPREQLYTLLDETAEKLRAMEPHSPIPYLIKRAVRLGRLPFPSLMRQVIREPGTLTELNREFGIAPPEETSDETVPDGTPALA